MSPAIPGQSYILVLKYPYKLRSPQYWPLTNIPFFDFSTEGLGKVKSGDVVVFKQPEPEKSMNWVSKQNLVKRCVGLPGDTVGIFLKHTERNNIKIDQRLNYSFQFYKDTLFQKVIIQRSKSDPTFFMMGDNRTQSFDSRFFGLVPKSNLIGRAEIKIWPWPPKWL